MKKKLYSLATFALMAFALAACEGDDASGNLRSNDAASSSSPTGKGGSMARFAINGDFLYTVDNTNLKVFNITTPAVPKPQSTVSLNFGVETIFPYKNNLFIGTSTGMYIFDVQTPGVPQQLSWYQHIVSCDPVAADDNYAYVTLRSGTTCRAGMNRLEIVDISNLQNPRLVKEYNMSNPKGLGVDGKKLFVCDDGLKVYDISDVQNLQLMQHFNNVNSYDVIPNAGLLLLTGNDGFYQYQYTNSAIQLLSKIPVQP
ncbi:MAG: hypothetical protein LPK19_07805, partial [Hymenobacteraceae bacterium]|nr:hypothetical protein [Hymenobacteraceae bacterium]MDX5396117.1 hypothetical protein [Hymenobacteraceae bacterium]MDX5512178.1 hypothetical protein [Hymenobacteraceae bacterium]